jgi:hypothetical protein
MSLRKGVFGKNYLTGVSVLKKLAASTMSAVKIHGMSG